MAWNTLEISLQRLHFCACSARVYNQAMDNNDKEYKQLFDQKTIEGLVLFGIAVFVIGCVLVGLKVLHLI